MAQNVIERIFGVMKMRSRVMKYMPRYDLEVQCSIVVACCVLHNIIREAGPEDSFYDKFDRLQREEEKTQNLEWAQARANNQYEEPNLGIQNEAHAARDAMAQAMFDDYMAHPRRQWR